MARSAARHPVLAQDLEHRVAESTSVLALADQERDLARADAPVGQHRLRVDLIVRVGTVGIVEADVEPGAVARGRRDRRGPAAAPPARGPTCQRYSITQSRFIAVLARNSTSAGNRGRRLSSAAAIAAHDSSADGAGATGGELTVSG